MAFAPFVPLRVLSAYSMLEGAIEPKAIAKLATERGFPAIAMCDRNGLYGSVPFANACLENGVQPIVGALLGVLGSIYGLCFAFAFQSSKQRILDLSVALTAEVSALTRLQLLCDQSSCGSPRVALIIGA